MKGIYLLEGNTLRLCFSTGSTKRPKTFPEQPKSGLVRMVLQAGGK